MQTGNFVEACTAVDCGKECNLQVLTGVVKQVELTECYKVEACCDACGLPESNDEAFEADLVRGCSCHSQSLKGNFNKVRLLECAADDDENAFNSVNAPSGTKQMSTENSQGFSDSRSTVHKLTEVKLADKLSVVNDFIVSHLKGPVSNTHMGSTKPCISKDCGYIYGPQSLDDNIGKEGMFDVKNHFNAYVLPGIDDDSRKPIHMQKCFAEYHDYMSGFQRTMDKVYEMWPVEPHAGLKSRFLAEILMDMSTVAVYWAQSVSSSAHCKRNDMDQHVGPLCWADDPREDNCQHAAPMRSTDSKGDDIDTGLLVSILLPQIKFLAQQYQKSLGSDLRQDLHVAKLMEFRGFGPDPTPDWIPNKTVELLCKHNQIGCIQGIFNPLFECMWLPWAQDAEFYHHLDVAMVCNQEMLHTGLHLKRLANVCFSWAIPTRPVLEYMISMAPHGKIAEIGSGLGYWAALLTKLGADVVAVDDFSESTGSLFFPETISMDGEEFVKQGGAIGRALFFCWPLKSHTQNFSLTNACKSVYPACFVEACLKAFHGDTVFFVGERDDGCTFDIAAWMQGTPKQQRTWRLEREIEIPTWPGVHDIFMCFVKHKDTHFSLTGKKKKRAARKARLAEETHSFLSERYAKEEDFLKASIAAYPECSLQ